MTIFVKFNPNKPIDMEYETKIAGKYKSPKNLIPIPTIKCDDFNPWRGNGSEKSKKLRQLRLSQ